MEQQEKKNVLVAVIDDSQFHLDYVMEQVKDAGWEPVGFDHATSFFAALKKGQRFDLIIADRMMPDYDSLRDDLPGVAAKLGNKAPIILNSTANRQVSTFPKDGFEARVLKNMIFPVAFTVLENA